MAVRTFAACNATNEAARSEHPEIMRSRVLTKAVMCDVSPFCATETLFNHEFWWRPESNLKSRCRTWTKDADWPIEPYLTRSRSRARSIWDTMRLLPNRTVWLHGDSIMLQMCDAAFCSLMRSGVAPSPVYQIGKQRPAWLTDVEVRSGYNFMTTLLPNGARFLCSGIGPYQRAPIEVVLPHVHVAMLNFGLHYGDAPGFRAMLGTAMTSLSSWQRAAPASRLALWREGSAQHFRFGSYRPGEEKRQPPGQPCTCTPLSPANAFNARESYEAQQTNLNLLNHHLEQSLSPPFGVGLVPFFNLTKPRHNMHRGHYCAFSNQKKPGRCCDCTHFCYTPLFWDAVFGGLYRAVRRSALGRPHHAAAGALSAVTGGGAAKAALSKAFGHKSALVRTALGGQQAPSGTAALDAAFSKASSGKAALGKRSGKARGPGGRGPLRGPSGTPSGEGALSWTSRAQEKLVRLARGMLSEGVPQAKGVLKPDRLLKKVRREAKPRAAERATHKDKGSRKGGVSREAESA